MSRRAAVAADAPAFQEDTARIQLVQHQLALFLWLNLTLLGMEGGVIAHDHWFVGRFLALALLLLTGTALAERLLWRLPKAAPLLSALCFFSLASLPLLDVRGTPPERGILLDLYYVLLVCSASFLRLWSWRVQGAAALFGVIAASLAIEPWGVATFVQSLLLVGVAGTLSTVVLFTRSAEADAAHLEVERQAYTLLVQAAKDRLARVGWNAVLLQAGLLAVLVFLDIVFHGDVLTQPLLTKVYGLIALVLGSLLMKASRPERLSQAFGWTTVFVGVVLSIARIGYADLHSFVAPVPLVYLALVVTVLPFAFELQLVVVWALLFNDLLVKIGNAWLVNGYSLDAVGRMFAEQRGEIAFLALGMTATAVLARGLHAHRLQNISKFVDPRRPGAQAAVDAGDQEAPVALPQVSRHAVSAERRSRLITGILIAGVPTCILVSQLLFTLGPAYRSYAVLAWVVFMLFGVGLLYLDRRSISGEILWMTGALVELTLLLVPCILLLLSPEALSYWLFWPAIVFLSFTFIPWRMQELVPVVLVALVAAIELLYHLSLGFPGVAVFTAAFLLGIICSRKGYRQLKEKLLLLSFPRTLSEAASERDTLRTLGDSLADLFDAGGALLSVGPQLEMVREGQAWSIAPALAEPFRTQPGHELAFSLPAVSLRAVNWLPASVRFFDRRFGVFSAEHVLLFRFKVAVDDPLRERGSLLSGSHAVISREERECVLYIACRLPVYEPLMGITIEVAGALVRMALTRLLEFEERRRQQRLELYFEARTQDREYELGALVHDVNNTVQDLTLLCDGILEDGIGEAHLPGERYGALTGQVKRISEVARSVATVLSDAKRKRELERMSDLQPRELVEVTQVITEIVSFATLRAERKRIKVEPPELPGERMWVRVSVREHLETILRNLFNNAILYSNPGAVVKLGFRYSDDWVWIDVTDTGPGLSSEEQEAVFRSGYRGRSASGIPGGLGLGLAESRRVAESAGGSLEVFSAGIGTGSTFTVKLPRQPAPVAAGAPLQHWALLVDDQAGLTEFYSRLAKALNCTPGVAGSIAEAIELVDRRGQPAFVITDIHLGADNGLDLVRHLRSRFGTALPILVVSGLTDDDISERARVAGASDFVAKPVGRRALFARIQSLLPLGQETFQAGESGR